MRTLLVCIFLSIFSFNAEARYFRSAHGKGRLGGVWANPAHWMKKHHLVGMAHHSAYNNKPQKLAKTKQKIQTIVALLVQGYKESMKKKIDLFTEDNALAPIEYCNNRDALNVDIKLRPTEGYKARLGFTSNVDSVIALTSTFWDKTDDINNAAKATDGVFGNLVDEFDSTRDARPADERESLCGMNNCDKNSVVGNLADEIRGHGYHVRHDDICQGKFLGSENLQVHPQCNLAPQEGKLSYYCGVKCKDIDLDENFLGHTCYDAGNGKNVFKQSQFEKNCNDNCNGIPSDNVITPGGASCPVYCDYNADRQAWEPDFDTKGSRITNLVEGCNLGITSSDCISVEATHCHRQIDYNPVSGEWTTSGEVNITQDCSAISDPYDGNQITWSNSELAYVKTLSGSANVTNADLCKPFNPLDGGSTWVTPAGKVVREVPNSFTFLGVTLNPPAPVVMSDYTSETAYNDAMDAYVRAVKAEREKAKEQCIVTTNADGLTGKWEEFYSEFVKPNADGGREGQNGLGEVCTYIPELSIPASQYVCEKADPVHGCVIHGLKSGSSCGDMGDINIDCSRNVTVVAMDGSLSIVEEDCFCAEECPAQYGITEVKCKTFFAPNAVVKNRRDEARRLISYSVAKPDEFLSIEFPVLRYTTGAFKSNVDEKGFDSQDGDECHIGSEARCLEDNDFCPPAYNVSNVYAQHSCKKSSGCQTFRSLILAMNGNAQLKRLRKSEVEASRAWWDKTIEETRNDLTRIAKFAEGLAGFANMIPLLGGDPNIDGDLKTWDQQVGEGCADFTQWASGQRGEMNAGMCGPETMTYFTWSRPKSNILDSDYFSREKAQAERMNCLCRGKSSYEGDHAKGFGDTAFLATTKAACLGAIDLQGDPDGPFEHASTERWCTLDTIPKDFGPWIEALDKLLPSNTLWSNTIPENVTNTLYSTLVESIGSLDKELEQHQITDGVSSITGYVYSRNRQDCGRITNAINGLHISSAGSDVITKSNIGGNCIPIKNLEKVLYHLEFELMADKRIATDYDEVVDVEDGGTGKPTFTSRMCQTGSEGDLSYRQIVFDWKEARCGSICSHESESQNLASPEPESDPNDAQYKTAITDSYASMCYIDLNQLMSGGSEILIAGKKMPDPLDYREDEVDEAAQQAIDAISNDLSIDDQRLALFTALERQFSNTGTNLAVYIGAQAGEHWLRVMQHVSARGHHTNLSPDDPTYEHTDSELYGADSGANKDTIVPIDQHKDADGEAAAAAAHSAEYGA